MQSSDFQLPSLGLADSSLGFFWGLAFFFFLLVVRVLQVRKKQGLSWHTIGGESIAQAFRVLGLGFRVEGFRV